MGTALLESVGNRLLASLSVQCSLLKWWCLLKVKGCWNVKHVIIFSCLANILLRILYSCIFLLIKDFLIHIHFGQSKICIFFRMVEIKYKYRMDWANFWQFSYQNKHSSERTLSLSLRKQLPNPCEQQSQQWAFSKERCWYSPRILPGAQESPSSDNLMLVLLPAW